MATPLEKALAISATVDGAPANVTVLSKGIQPKQAAGETIDAITANVRANLIEKASKSPSAVGPWSGDIVRDGMFKHVIDQRGMVLAVNNNWMLGAAVDKRVQELVKNVTNDPKELFKPKFASKCKACEHEHQYDVDECEQCGSTELLEPDPRQLKRILKLFEHPNSDDEGEVTQTFKDILRTLGFYNTVTDDYYLEVQYDMSGAPAEIYAVSAEYIRVAAKRGKYSGKFCPICWNPEIHDRVYGADKETCDKCGGKLAETAYIQLNDADKIVGRFTGRSLKRNRSRAHGRRVYGVSPIESVWAAAQILRWMELYQWSTYSNNKSINSIVWLPNLSQNEVFEIQDSIMERKDLNPANPLHLWIGGGATQGATGQPAVINAMPTLVDLNAKEMALFIREAIAIRLGVSLNVLGVQTPGKLGKETETVEVSFDAFEEMASNIDEFFNNKLIPLFKVHAFGTGEEQEEITDWIFELPSPKKDDLQRKEAIETARIQKAQLLQQMGYQTEFDDEFEVRIVATPDELQADLQNFGPGMNDANRNDPDVHEFAQALQTMKPGESLQVSPDSFQGSEEKIEKIDTFNRLYGTTPEQQHSPFTGTRRMVEYVQGNSEPQNAYYAEIVEPEKVLQVKGPYESKRQPEELPTGDRE